MRLISVLPPPQRDDRWPYAVASGASAGSTLELATARPAITMVNSPRGISASPARHRPGAAMPARRAARQPVSTVDRRPMQVPVPAYYDPPHLEFDNAQLGYALFPGCTRSPDAGDPVPCPPLLFVTFDSGESWEQREYPASGEGPPSMLVGYGSLVLFTAAAWYRSLDAGSTFTRSVGVDASMPSEFALVDGPYQVCCQTDPVARVVAATEQGMVPLAQQPPIPVVQTAGCTWRPARWWPGWTIAGRRTGNAPSRYSCEE